MVVWLTKHWFDALIIVLLVTAAFTVRLPITVERKIMPAGDAFNFQHIADHIIHGKYPAQEKRLPGYPALILLTRPLPIERIDAAVGISLVVSSLMLATLYGIGRHLTIHRLPLTAVLSVSIFDPLLTIGAIRPLSDATFLFFVTFYLLLIVRELTTKNPTTRRSLVLIGLAAVAMILTRFEGVPIAGLTLPLLWLKVSWRQVLLAGAIPLVAGLLWIPVHLHIHGSLMGGYITELSQSGGDSKNIKTVSVKFMTLVKSAGWGNAWAAPQYEITQEPKREAVQRLMTQGSWWLSLLAVIGVPWLLITKRAVALPLLLAALGYIAVLVWWLLYSRFVIPLIPFFYLTSAAGGSFLLHAVSRLWGRSQSRVSLGASLIAVGIFLGWILWAEAPGMYGHALGRAWENNYRGYALYRATLALSETDGLVVAPDSSMIAVNLFGVYGANPEPPNSARGLYLDQFPDADANKLYTEIMVEHPRYLLDSADDPRLPELVKLLEDRGRISATEIFISQPWYSDKESEIIKIHTLEWGG